MMAKSMRDINALYKAIQKYVEHRSGKILVIGGIEIQEWPLQHPCQFKIAISCLGKKPIVDATELVRKKAHRKGGD